jgi:hypothetical protein
MQEAGFPPMQRSLRQDENPKIPKEMKKKKSVALFMIMRH